MKPSLSQVADYFDLALQDDGFELSDCWADARLIKDGGLFIALEGEAQHRANFWQQAVDNQAVAIVLDPLTVEQNLRAEIVGIQVLEVPNLVKKLAGFLNWFYQQPSKQLQLIGITGTNGKTSSAFFTAQILQALGFRVAMLGTLGNGLYENLTPSPNTTLEIVALYRTLYGFVAQQVDYVVMEVSSHALALGRVAGLEFAAVAMTQVTRDHLDFHGSEAAYQAEKAKLFTDYKSLVQVLNLDDRLGQQLHKTVSKPVMFSQLDTAADLRVTEAEFSQQGFRLKLHWQKQTYSVAVPLVGSFQVENLMCALSIVLALKLKAEDCLRVISRLQAPKGRMSLVHQQPMVLIDYAHTPDALQQALLAARKHLSSEGVLYVVFGCGGDRDQGKRPLMGQVAEKFADKVVLTDDNPRFESTESIIQQILSGMETSPEIIADRSQAIAATLATAVDEDLILIAGKGHEDYQEIQGEKRHFSDFEVVTEFYGEMS